ncbi:MAG: hypothetical protein JRE65_15595, partial [Deltaproteobacteria bacterium]|nr:hypothetical protein [Deltaproteobacteria bacterium]
MKNTINAILMTIVLSLFSGRMGLLNSYGDVGNKVPEETSEQTLNNKSVFTSSYYLKKANTYVHKDELQSA